jgi:hypothetical protein
MDDVCIYFLARSSLSRQPSFGLDLDGVDFTEAGHTLSFSFGLVGPYISWQNCQQSLFEREREVCDKHNQLCVLCFVCVRVYFYSIVEEE